jgi:hypothetical protein
MIRAAILAVALAAGTPQQFDLVCSGRLRDGDPITVRYIVDLAGNRWCKQNGCTIKPLAEVNNTQIVFVDVSAAFPGDPSRSLDYVDRTNGNWSFFTSFWMGDGTCTPAPFSGFPTMETKF